jgi:hypothetical protein
MPQNILAIPLSNRKCRCLVLYMAAEHSTVSELNLVLCRERISRRFETCRASLFDNRRSQKDVVYLGTPIAPPYRTPNAKARGGGKGSANKYSCTHMEPIFNLCLKACLGIFFSSRGKLSWHCQTCNIVFVSASCRGPIRRRRQARVHVVA